MKFLKIFLASTVIYSIYYFYFSYNGAITHNDTIAYVSFAKLFMEGYFPKSYLYQPGVGLFIYIIKLVTGFDLINSFRLLNFIYGLGAVLILNQIFYFPNYKFSVNIVLIILLTIFPFFMFNVNTLYADVGFVFYALLSLYILSNYFEKRKIYLLVLASFFITISIFTKYNGLSVFITGVVYIIFSGCRSEFFIKKIIDIVILSIMPLSYIIFWKLFNGNLGGVEFNSYIKVISIDCITQYLKINLISFYHLFLEIVFFSFHSKIFHLYLILPFLIFVSTFIYFFKNHTLNYFKYFVQNKFMVLLFLVTLIYTISLLSLESLNCLTEISIRLFLLPISITYTFLIHFIIYLFKLPQRIFSKFLLISVFAYVLFFLIFYSKKYKESQTPFLLSKIRENYGSEIALIDSIYQPNNSYSTAGIYRGVFLVGKNYHLMNNFPYQSYYDYDKKITYSNPDYFILIKNKLDHLNDNSILIIELNDKFLAQYNDSLKKLNDFLLLRNKIVVFKK
jgi:hypothetical protein